MEKRKVYDLKKLKGDLTGGLVAGVVALPLALAFGVQSGMGATAGLYGAIALGILAALLGGTATQVSGPTGPMTVVAASVVAAAIARTGGLEQGFGLIILVFLLAGAFQVLFGFLNIARYIRYFPYPVISGFMTGVGLIIVLLQIYPFMGATSPSSTLGVITQIGEPLANINWSAVGLGLLTVAIFYLFPRITRAVPSALVALVVSSLVATLLRLDVPLIGAIPEGLPSLQFGAITSVTGADLLFVVEFAVVLAALGSIDSLLTSVIADNITKTQHNSNRELIGQGIGNIAAALVGGIPGAGATKGTVVNIKAGGETRLSGAVHGIFLLAVLLGAGRYAAFIPLSVLAGILIPIGLQIVDTRGLKHLLRVPRADAAVYIAVLGFTVFGSLIQAVGLGIVLASVLFMKKASDLAESGTSVSALAGVGGEKLWSDEIEVYHQLKDRVVIKHLYGPMFFGFTSHFQELIKKLNDDVRAVIIRMDRVPYMDQSGLYAMEDAIMTLRQKNVDVLITGIQQQPLDMLHTIDIVPDLLPGTHLFENFEDSVAWLKRESRRLNGEQAAVTAPTAAAPA